MGDNSTCKTVGTGDTRITMFDGMTCTISDVRRIPSLQKNLVFGKIWSGWYKFTLDNGRLKIAKGALIVGRAELQ